MLWIRREAALESKLCLLVSMPLEAPSTLEQESISPAVAEDYRVRHETLLASEFGDRLDLLSPPDFEQRMLAYFLHSFAESVLAGEGFKTLAAIGHYYPHHRKHGPHRLPRVRRLLLGWGRLLPEVSIAPPPRITVCGVAARLARQYGREMSSTCILALRAS